MTNSYFLLFAWFYFLFASVVIHEASHVLVGIKSGWQYNGFYFAPKFLGVGVRLEPNDSGQKKLWLIAVSGPIASFITGLIFFAFANIATGNTGMIFYSLFMLNIVIAIINLIPTPVTDGGHILTSLFGWKMKWRYLIFPWIGIEIAGILLYLF